MLEREIELFHQWGSIQSFKVRVCLAELCLGWVSRRIDLSRFENLEPSYLAIHPQGLVPALKIGSEVTTESSVINERLDLIAGGKLLPEDAETRRRVRDWTELEDTVVHPAVRPPTFNLILKPRLQRLSPAEIMVAMERHPLKSRAEAYRQAAIAPVDVSAVIGSIVIFQSVLARMEIHLSQARWLAGDGFTLADVAMAAFIDRLGRLAMEGLLAPFPLAADWADRIRQRPSFAAAKGPEAERPDPPVDRHLVDRLMTAADAHVQNQV
ncbi:MAG TPA: glutathione S-transferase family protein [Ensifer sp.]|jgi:glutathione S-transferase|uniref:glutathione S-transferase family protein n=1 Tax=Ensifer sp. TaxID=1872086 RepID=UPI002E119E25|nr:glutathione S-transferase family protein [Ensifer sp.]